ncbi:MAG: hypothetical protein Gaeavirus1_28 [Gaeavirus sp.]|uniref:Uncharacterized protein n=1 Tax=Gaeavirus sp. TaxID=2487767 RepID=A0A3G5A127_9VIRU|nr:MAG: hypothetical protein Gaeavirus1_28 [Gaeavirus sp.]
MELAKATELAKAMELTKDMVSHPYDLLEVRKNNNHDTVKTVMIQSMLYAEQINVILKCVNIQVIAIFCDASESSLALLHKLATLEQLKDLCVRTYGSLEYMCLYHHDRNLIIDVRYVSDSDKRKKLITNMKQIFDNHSITRIIFIGVQIYSFFIFDDLPRTLEYLQISFNKFILHMPTEPIEFLTNLPMSLKNIKLSNCNHKFNKPQLDKIKLPYDCKLEVED